MDQQYCCFIISAHCTWQASYLIRTGNSTTDRKQSSKTKQVTLRNKRLVGRRVTPNIIVYVCVIIHTNPWRKWYITYTICHIHFIHHLYSSLKLYLFYFKSSSLDPKTTIWLMWCLKDKDSSIINDIMSLTIIAKFLWFCYGFLFQSAG